MTAFNMHARILAITYAFLFQPWVSAARTPRQMRLKSILNPPRAELSQYGLKQVDDDDSVDIIGGADLFDKMDIYYHQYYTSSLRNYTNLKGKKCKNGDFICPYLPGTYGLCFMQSEFDNICDGVNDCLNGADEAMCKYLRKGTTSTPTNLFDVIYNKKRAKYNCGQGKGLPDDWMCDGYCDCAECWDETKSKCPDLVANKMCSEGALRCDGLIDCMDRTDEIGCTSIKKTDGKYKGKTDKGTPNKRTMTWYPCDDKNKTQQWYHKQFVCDGRNDCTDGSDEKYCQVKSKPLPKTYKSRLLTCNSYGGMLCRPGKDQPLMCIKETDICSLHWKNPNFKCIDGDPAATPLETILVTAKDHSKCTSQEIKCRYEEFKCRRRNGGWQCLPGIKLYDGVADCYNPTHDTSSTNSSSIWSKLNFSKKKTETWNTTEYPDDENPIYKKVENEKKATMCSCPKLNGKFKCADSRVFSYNDAGTNVNCDCRCVRCQDGYEMDQSSGVCVDRNECDWQKFAEMHHPCSHGCINTQGSYVCSCPAGLILSLDRHTCRPLNAKEHPVNLYVAQQDQIAQLELSISSIEDVDSRATWSVRSKKTIFEKIGMTFTAIAIDENDDIYSETASGDREKAIVYFGSYRKDSTVEEYDGGTIYRWDQRKAANNQDYVAEVYYRFKTGSIEGMAFDYITRNLHVTLSNHLLETKCKLKDTTGQQKAQKVGMHVIFPTGAKSKHKAKCTDCVGPNPFWGHHVSLKKPRAIVVIPERATVIIFDWIGNNEKQSVIHKIHFGDKNSASFSVDSKTIKMQYLNAAVYDKFRHRVLLFDAKKVKTYDGKTRDTTVIGCDIDFKKCAALFNHPSEWLFSAAVFGRDVLFGEMKHPEITRMNRFNPADVSVLTRFNKQVYNMALQNMEIQTKSHAIQNPEICGADRQNCDYMCVTHSLFTYSSSIDKRRYNATESGIMGALCLCPDGSRRDANKACDVSTGNHVIKHAGFVLARENTYQSKLRVYDIEKGSNAHRYLQLRQEEAVFFNGSAWRIAEFYNPLDKKVYKWDPVRGLVHQLSIRALKCSSGVPINQVSGSPVDYSSYKAMESTNMTVKSKYYSYTTLGDKWLAGYNEDVRHMMQRPIVVKELGIVCGRTYTVQSPRQYIVYCTKIDDFARPWGTQRKAVPLYTSRYPFTFAIDKYTLFVMDRYRYTLSFHDLYTLDKGSGAAFHTANIKNISKEYQIRQDMFYADGIGGRVMMVNRRAIFEYNYSNQKNKDANGTALADTLTTVFNVTKEYPLESWCRSGNKTGQLWVTGGFQDITAIGNRIYGVWQAECELVSKTNETDISGTSTFTYNGMKYRYIPKTLMFSCTQTTRGAKFTDCTTVSVDPEMGFHLDTTGKAVPEIHPAWHFFVDIESPPVAQVKCASECEYFCAQDTTGVGNTFCVCPIDHQFDKVQNKCLRKEDCLDKCVGKDTADSVCLTANKYCDGKQDCQSNIDESFCKEEREGGCGANEFDCNHTVNGNVQCIPYNKVCDGTSDCVKTDGNSEGPDELASTCKLTSKNCTDMGKFFCGDAYSYSYYSAGYSSVSTGNCIPWDLVADGKSDCSKKGAADESYYATKSKCTRDGKFHCRLAMTCVDNSTRCDGIHDCGIYKSKYSGKYRLDRSDEKDYFCRNLKLPCSSATHFQCKSSGQCIRHSLVCNGQNDCIEGEDEDEEACKRLGKTQPQSTLQYHTGDREKTLRTTTCESKMYCLGSSGFWSPTGIMTRPTCISPDKLCDGIDDCLDRSDETANGDGKSCKDACQSLNAKEKQLCGKCTNTPWGPECECPALAGLSRYKRLSGIGTKSPNCTYRNMCEEVVGTCDQVCKSQQFLNPQTKGPYQCSCQPYKFELGGDRYQHCKAVSQWKVAAMDQYGQIEIYELYPDGSHIAPMRADHDETREFNNMNALKRSLTLNSGDHRGSVAHTFTLDIGESAIYSVETAIDNFDAIYVHSTRGVSNWDIVITLPQLWVDSIAPGFSHRAYSYLFIGASMPTTSSKIGYGIYALSLSGNPALLLSTLPKNGKEEVLQYPVRNLIHIADQDKLYFSHGQELWFFKLKTSTAHMVYRFDGDITEIQEDSGWFKLFIVVDHSRVFYTGYNSASQPLEVPLSIPLNNITSISIYEDKLAVTNDDYRYPHTIFNKFTGAELPAMAKTIADIKASGIENTLATPRPVKFVTYYNQRRRRKRTKWTDVIDDRLNIVNGAKDGKTDVKICPQNTFNLVEHARRVNYTHCYCLGWGLRSNTTPVAAIPVSAYNTTKPCGEPTCDAGVLMRYPLLRRGLAGKTNSEHAEPQAEDMGSYPTGGPVDMPSNVESYPSTAKLRSLSGSPWDRTGHDYFDMENPDASMDFDTLLKELADQAETSMKIISDSEDPSVDKKEAASDSVKLDIKLNDGNIFGELKKMIEEVKTLTVKDGLKPGKALMTSMCQPGLKPFRYEYVKSTYHSTGTNLAKKGGVEKGDGFSYMCNRIGEFSGNDKHTNTYHLHIDGAFVGGPNFSKEFERHSKQRDEARNQYYKSTTYSFESYRNYMGLQGLIHSQFFGPSFFGKYCDYAESYLGSLRDRLFKNRTECVATGCDHCRPFYEFNAFKVYYGTDGMSNVDLAGIEAMMTQNASEIVDDTMWHCFATVATGKGGKRDDIKKAILDKLSVSSSSGVVLAVVLVLLGMAGCIVALFLVKTISMPSSPYGGNNKFSYQDLDEDRDNVYQDQGQRKLSHGSGMPNNNKYDPEEPDGSLANDEFDYSVQSSATQNLIDTDACMGFNIPKNRSEWGAPPAFESPPREADALIRMSTETKLPEKNVVMNPFYGSASSGSQQMKKSDSNTPIIDL